MVFSSISFLYYFLPLALVCYFLTPVKYRNLMLFFVSLAFYFYGEPRYVLLMLATILSSYINGQLIEKYRGTKYQKIGLILDIIISLGLLGFFKYSNFIIENINNLTKADLALFKVVLPVGISFYTFQTLSYSIDVYRGAIKAQKNFITLGTYVVLFPQLVAGPIVRYSEIEQELIQRNSSYHDIALGFRRFILGLTKKVIIANNLGLLGQIFITSTAPTVLFYWLSTLSYMLQIYFDFSGYSDMAIGLGRIFGFTFPENFNYPYVAKSITDFWRRWHMTLSFWFKDYLYIPLGGSRTTKFKYYRNLLIVWFLTGLWHGAAWNFIVWGFYFGGILIIEKLGLLQLLKKVPTALQHLYTLMIVYFSWLIFNATSLAEMVYSFKALFGLTALPLINQETWYYLTSYGLIIIIAVLGATPLLRNLIQKVKQQEKGLKLINALEPLILTGLLVAATAYLIDSSFNPFIYFRF